MSDVIRIDFNALGAGAQTLRDQASRLQQLISDTLPSDLVPLQQTWWSQPDDPAAQSANKAWSQVVTATTDLISAMNQLATQVEDAQQNQLRLQQSIASSFGYA